MEYQQDDPPDERNKRDENPPAGTIYVVEPPDRHGDARDQNRQAEDGAQQACSRRTVVFPDEAINKAEHDADDDHEQDEVPVLLPPGASAENGVLFQRLDKQAQSAYRSPPLRTSTGLDNPFP